MNGSGTTSIEVREGSIGQEPGAPPMAKRSDPAAQGRSADLFGGKFSPFDVTQTIYWALPVVSAGIQDLRACLLGEGRSPRPRTYPRKNHLLRRQPRQAQAAPRR